MVWDVCNAMYKRFFFFFFFFLHSGFWGELRVLSLTKFLECILSCWLNKQNAYEPDYELSQAVT